MINRGGSIRDLARGLPLGGSRSGLVCPKCHGGRTGEGSLSVTVAAEGIYYKCHRDNCDLAGLRGGLEAGLGAQPSPFVPRPYPLDLVTPDPDHWLWRKVGTYTESEHYAAKLGVSVPIGREHELVWEVRDFDWQPRGHISRTYPDKFIRSWRVVDGPWMNYVALKRSDTLFIVEDCVSAARIACRGKSALALLGTNLSGPGRAELGAFLNRFPHTRVRVALDPDASATASKLARDLTFSLGRDILFVPMKADPKDLSRPDFEELLRG